MKKLALAVVAAAAFTGSAIAADMPARTYSKAPPPPAPVMSWTGCWISGGAGYQYDRINHETFGGTISTLRTQNISNAADGWLITGGVGCDYQFSGRWVIGGFVDGTWSDNVHGDYSVRLTGVGDIGIGRIKNPWSWAVGARVGYLVAPNVLSYVNAGFTQTHFDAVNVFDRLTNGGAFTGIQVAGQTLDGVFLGTGFEYSFDWLPGLFLKSEGRAAWFGHKNTAVACVTAGTVCAGPGGPPHSSPSTSIGATRSPTWRRPSWSTASTGVARSSRSTDFPPDLKNSKAPASAGAFLCARLRRRASASSPRP